MDVWQISTQEIVMSCVGYLVFLVGLSLCFESLALGALFTVGSLFVIPFTRRRFVERTGVDVPRLAVAAVVLTSLAAPSVVFEEYETGTYFGTEEDVSVRVSYDGEWTSEANAAYSYRQRSGTGNATYEIADNSGRIEAVAAKDDGTDGTLTLSLLVGEEVVATATAGPGERRASVEYTIGLLGD
jgi:hypothetical protein